MDRAGSSDGLTLVEAMVAMGLVALAAVAILPAFMEQLRSNTRNEERAGAVAAVQRQLETLRLEDPGVLPTSGSSAPVLIVIGRREYLVRTTFCSQPAFCDSDTRQVLVEASVGTKKIYDAETVYTRLF